MDDNSGYPNVLHFKKPENFRILELPLIQEVFNIRKMGWFRAWHQSFHPQDRSPASSHFVASPALLMNQFVDMWESGLLTCFWPSNLFIKTCYVYLDLKWSKWLGFYGAQKASECPYGIPHFGFPFPHPVTFTTRIYTASESSPKNKTWKT